MRKSLVRKGIVFGIIILFVGASVVSGIGNNLSKVSVKKLDNVDDETGEIECNDLVLQSDRINEQIIYDNSPQPLVSVGWWNVDWLFRKQITINHTMVDVNLTNFPVLISNTSLDFAEKAQSDGDDFIFTSEDNLSNN